MNRKGFTLIELLVVIAIIGVLAAILIPNILGAIQKANKTTDANNLKELVKGYLSAKANNVYPATTSTGPKFWLAMFCGDTSIKQSDLKETFNIGQVGLLCCPLDKGLKDKAEMGSLIETAQGQANGLTTIADADAMCSYSGPTSIVAFSKGKLVACTGSRSNMGFFEDGFNGVNGNGGCEYYKYEDLATSTPNEWKADQTEPSWTSDMMKYVKNIGSN